MAGKGITFNEQLGEYLVAHSDERTALQRELVEETREALGDVTIMQIAEEQGAFMTMLTRLVGATFAVEVGTFTGYSAMAIAEGLDHGGRLLCCDVSEEFTNIARRYWTRAGLDDRIDLVVAPAIDTLEALDDSDVIDFAFIDADKTNYHTYYELLLARMRPGGLIVVDNVLWSGTVLDPDTADDDPQSDLRAIKAFNDAVVADPRVHVSMVNVGDGLSLIRKR